jgi:hypothetical protein
MLIRTLAMDTFARKFDALKTASKFAKETVMSNIWFHVPKQNQ